MGLDVVATSPVFVERAHGARLVDVDGREYIDFVGGIGTLNGGHTPEAVVRAIQQQAERYLHQCFSIAHVRAVHRGLPAPLRASTRAPVRTRRMLVNSGAEAVENAVKIARYATGPRTPSCASTRRSTAARC